MSPTLRRGLTTGLLLLSTSCAHPRPAAPPDLDTLLHGVFRDFEAPRDLAPQVEGIARWMRDDGATPEAWDGQLLTDLDAEHVADIDLPVGTVLSEHVGMLVAGPSAFPTTAHAELVLRRDQTWVDPGSYLAYQRDVVEGTRDCFLDTACMVRTDNVVDRSGGFGIEIPYGLRKDYRWVHLTDGPVLVSRNWVSEPGCSDNGKNCVVQSFGLDLFLPHDGETRRLLTTWVLVTTEVDALLGEDARIALIAKGNQDIVLAAEAELGGEDT